MKVIGLIYENLFNGFGHIVFYPCFELSLDYYVKEFWLNGSRTLEYKHIWYAPNTLASL